MSPFAQQAGRAIFGLQLRTTVLLTGIVLAATGLTGAVCLRIASRLAGDEAARHARELARGLAISSADDVRADRRDRLLRTAHALVPEGELDYVVFADSAGRVQAAYQKGTGLIEPLLLNDVSTIAVTPLDRPRFVARPGLGSHVDIVFPITRPAESTAASGPRPIVGYVRLGLGLDSLEARMSAMVRRVIALATGVALLMVPLGYAVVRRVIGPINRLAAAAQDVASGRLNTRVDINGRDEIGELGRAFNHMASDLASTRDDLVAINVELEQRVRHRTKALANANDELRREIAEKDDFVRTVSHDLSAPMRNAAGMVARLRGETVDQLAPGPAQRLDRIDHNLEKGLELIDELLKLSKLQTGPIPCQRVDLREEVEALASQLEHDLDRKRLALSIEGDLPIVYASRRLIRQLFQNLIDNAIKYTDTSSPSASPGCGIVISAERNGRDWWIRVADRGIGVAPDDAERIFHVFRRSSRPGVQKVPGAGVGLAYCKTIVQRLGGRIWVEPNPGGGSVFCFTMRCTRPDGDLGDPAVECGSGVQPRQETDEPIGSAS